MGFLVLVALTNQVGVGGSTARAGSAARRQDPTASTSFVLSPVAAAGGDALNVSGRCVDELGPVSAADAFVRLFLKAPQPGTPFDFYKHFLADATGAWTGTLIVPGDSPTGDYASEMSCADGDAVFATLDGPQVRIQAAETTDGIDAVQAVPRFTG